MLQYLKITICTFWLSMLPTGNIFSQNSFDAYQELLSRGGIESSEIHVDSLINSLIMKDSVESAIAIIHNYSLKLYRIRNYEKGLKYVFWEKKLYEKINLFNKKYINIILNAGLFSMENYELERSILFFEEVLQKDSFNHKVSSAYFQLGKVYLRMGNYIESEINYLKAIRLSYEQKDYNRLIMSYINLYNNYLIINSKQSILKSKKILETMDSLTTIFKVSPKRYMLLQNSIAANYIRQGNYDLARASKYYKRNLSIGYQYQDSATLVNTYINLGYLHNKLKSDSTRYFLEKAKNYLKDDFIKAKFHENYAEFYIRTNKLEQALSHIKSALMYNLGSEVHIAPNKNRIFGSRDKDYLLFCIRRKIQIYIKLFQKHKKFDFLKVAMENIKATEHIVSLSLNNTNEQDTQMIWRREASQAYLYGAYASHLLGNSEQAFSFMEKNRALLLSESILKNTEFANLPKHISQQETAFQKQIYTLEDKLSKDEDSPVLQDSLFNAKRIHEKYVDSLKTIYPKYFTRKINVDQIPLTEVQQELEEDDAVLSYIWNDFDDDQELIIGLIATKDEAQTFKIKNTQEVREQLIHYRKLISDPFTTKEERASFQKVGYQLFSNLLPNEGLRAMIRNKNLTIIPDGDLQNIPFESLITKKNSDEYLVLNADVNYAYSYSFLKHNEQVNRKTKETFIGYSPNSFESFSLPNLSHTKEEVEMINKSLNGSIKLQDLATKEDFLANSSNSKIIHLATHADVGKNPWIAFADEKLELHELCTYKNNADLVTLSACNTSLGEFAKGEGVLSLARGFFYSGSKSVVSSLWEVNDKATSEIMINFYGNLKEGQTKSEALNNAKRTYLSNHSLSEKSPYYWSSFVLIGDPGILSFSSNQYLYFGVIIAILPLVTLLLYGRKKAIQTHKKT